MIYEKRFNLEIEKAILGDCLKNPKSLEKLLLIGVEKEDFYNPINQSIYKTFKDTYSKHRTIDIALVASEDRNTSISYLAELLSGAISINLKAHINVLMNLSVYRRYLKLANEIREWEVNNVGDYIKSQAEKIEKIKGRLNSDNTIITLDKVNPINIYEVEEVRTGFKDIDKQILGFIMGSLNVITGYNGNGKSTLINQMCIAESLSQGYKVFAYSPELTNSNLKSWLYPTIAIEEHFITKDYFSTKYKVVGDIGIKFIDNWISDKFYIYTDDSITNSGDQLLKDMEYMAEAKDVKIFIIDNLMKIDLEGSYKNELLAQKIFVNRLKEFSRKYNSIVHLVAHPRKA